MSKTTIYVAFAGTLVAMASTSAMGVTLFTYEPPTVNNTNATEAPVSPNAAITASNLSAGAGLTRSNAAGYAFRDWLSGDATATLAAAAALSVGDYYTFTITAGLGSDVFIDNIALNVRRTGTTITNNVTIYAGATPATATPWTNDVLLNPSSGGGSAVTFAHNATNGLIPAGTSVTFYILGYNVPVGTPSATSSLVLQNNVSTGVKAVAVNGQVPTPGAAALGGLGALAALRRRR